MNSPIKYFGGKNGISNKILEYFPIEYEKMTYLEPFCGSAALLFHKKRSVVEILNDLDENIYSLFNVLIDENKFSEFKKLCDLSFYSEQIYSEYLEDLKSDISDVERAYKYFYINRISFNGIGGFSSSGVVRRNMSKSVSDFLSSIDGLFDVHNRLSSVIIHNRNAIDLIKKWDKDNVFIYCDSPYDLSTRKSGGYKYDMTDDDQNIYLKTLLNIEKANILVSGYNCERYNILVDNGWKRVDMIIKSHNNNIKGNSRTESLWFNY